ncbi:hypothetical protein KSF_012740 [Reticulibacter mediterranei]|uniref:PPM-type phosphatase domain-containing protein n=1 Tax=Reticulibacter mediterranei TaxID=2778369 RepID=A0A8J3IBA5_9CHLR|nr:hypothetical protein [Reticulibacter mediterranei]GHO91226.1 hypothetical protein KSF_012740 [Reticulibacter mediterranei]
MSRHIHTALHNHNTTLPHFIFAHRTLACERHPDRNEDSILIDQPGGLAGVFDGVGAAPLVKSLHKRLLMPHINAGDKY